MKQLPLTVLAYDGPIARAYLCGMRRAGLKPNKPILLLLRRSGARAARHRGWIASALLMQRVRARQDAAHNFLPRDLMRRDPALVRAVSAALADIGPDAESLIADMYRGSTYEAHARERDRATPRNGE